MLFHFDKISVLFIRIFSSLLIKRENRKLKTLLSKNGQKDCVIIILVSSVPVFYKIKAELIGFSVTNIYEGAIPIDTALRHYYSKSSEICIRFNLSKFNICRINAPYWSHHQVSTPIDHLLKYLSAVPSIVSFNMTARILFPAVFE